MLITLVKKYAFLFFIGMYFTSGASEVHATTAYSQLFETSTVTVTGPSAFTFDPVSTPLPFNDTIPDDLYVKVKVKNVGSGSTVQIINIIYNSEGKQCYYYQGNNTTDEIAVPADDQYHEWVTGPWLTAADPAGDCGEIGTGWYFQANTLSGGSFAYKTNTGESEPWIQISDVNTFTPPADGVTISTPSAMTYTGNPIPFTGSYNNNASYDTLQFALVFNENMNMLFNSLALPLTNGFDLPWSVVRALPYSGQYTLRARLYDSVTASTTAWSATTTFALNSTSTNPLYLPESPVSTEECALSDLICHGKQLFAWAFIPSSDSTEQFKTLSSELETKFPFVYVYQVGDLREELFSATQTATSTVSATIRGMTFTFLSKEMIEGIPYTSLIKTILGWLMWFFLIDTIYRQVLRIHNSETK